MAADPQPAGSVESSRRPERPATADVSDTAVSPGASSANVSETSLAPEPLSAVETAIRSLGVRVRAASLVLAGASSAQKDAALRTAADLLEARADEVLRGQRRRR